MKLLILSREEFMRIYADNYYYFLRSLPYDNEIYMKGMGEARTKFLANLHITTTKEYLPKGYKNWRYTTDYVSEKALELLKKRQWGRGELVYEHIVPKTKYIKEACENAAQNGELSPDFIYHLLMRYYWTATIHKTEDNLLIKNTMPKEWDEVNIFARYDEANIKLIKHDKSYFLIS